MMTFCNDVDLLHWEPNLFVDAAAAAQKKLSGTGNLVGTTFTISAGSLASSHVAEEDVIVLSGATAGTFPIVSVESTTVLTLSVLYDGLYPEDGSDPQPIAVGANANGLDYAVRTFWAQRKVVSDLLRHAAGLGLTSDDEAADAEILNPDVLRRACALGTLQMIYNALAATIPADTVTPYNARAQTYAKLYRQAIGAAKVEVDLDGDGKADEVRALNVVRFIRV
jgi:hypothetical protein